MRVLLVFATMSLAGCGMSQQVTAPPPNSVNSGPLAFMPCLVFCNMQTTVEDQYGNAGTVEGGDISNSQSASVN